LAVIASLEQWIDGERDQLALWLPVGLGVGIAGWFTIATHTGWIAFMLTASAGAMLALALLGVARAGRAVAVFLMLATLGCALAWWRAESVAMPTLQRPLVADFVARVDTVELLAARDIVRVTLVPDTG
jgi:competence protein ComEC